MTQELGEITIYNPSMAENAAQMFNSFNEIWPGGFGGGIPYTAQRVHDWLDKSSAIADLIVIDEDGELGGYCGLYPHWRDKHAAYISILGVTPKAKGKGFGKRLLLKSLEIAEKKGITRVDLHTWSGNLDAVPLYKKTGLFWVPDTSVYMQDYIPGILQNSIAKKWFAKHQDWYKCFIRDLELVQDKQITDNMELYEYKFEKDNDKLTVEIDRFGWGIVGIERILDNKKISIKTRVEKHDIFVGLPNTFTIEIQSDYEETAEVKINVGGFTGLLWKEPFPTTVTVKRGEVTKISRDFNIDKSAKLFKDNDHPCEAIKTKITIGNKVIDLFTSGKIQTPVRLQSIEENRFKLIPSDNEILIPIDLINTTQLVIEGFIQIRSKKIPNISVDVPFSLSPSEIFGINFPITISKQRNTNNFPVNMTPYLKFNDKTIELPTFELPLIVFTNELLEIVELKDLNQLFLITDVLTIRVALEGGIIRVYHQDNIVYCSIVHSTGPPYGISLDTTLLYEYQILKESTFTILKLSAKSQQIKGLLVEKNLKIKPGLKEVEYWVNYTNTEEKKLLHASARTNASDGGININPGRAKGRTFAPLNGKFVENESFTNTLTDPLIPSDPQIWTETWVASEGLDTNELSAIIWDPKNIKKIKLRSGQISSIESDLEEIKPKKTYQPVHLWYTFGSTTLQQIRQRWNQLIGNKEFDFINDLQGPKLTKTFDVQLFGERVFIAGETYKRTIVVSTISAYQPGRKLNLILPENWQGTFITSEGEKSEIHLPEMQPFSTETIEITLAVPKLMETMIENIQIHLSGEYEIDFDNFVLVTPRGDISVKERVIENNKILEVDNGEIIFKVVSELGGALIRLEDKQGRTFLFDQFPEIKPKFFIEKHIGGIQPYIFHTFDNIPFKEFTKSTSEPVEIDKWKGTKTSWTITKTKDLLHGLHIELKYLTIPKSRIIRIILTAENQSTRTIPCINLLLSDIGFQGSIEGSSIEIASSSGQWYHNCVKQQFTNYSSFHKPFSRISNDEQSIAIIIPEGYKGSTLVMDMVVMLAILAAGIEYLKPKSKANFEYLITLNQSNKENMELMKVLGK